MRRVYEVGFEAKLNGSWSGNFSRRTVIVQGAAAKAIAKAERLEREVSFDDNEKPYPVRAEYAKLIAVAE